MTFDITEEEIGKVEKILLPAGCHFSDEARTIIRCWDSHDVVACPGSGKTTVLLAKIKLLADRMPFPDGAGICVLSHTNVAVDTIKSKFAGCEDKLLGYPNFVGTIQAFVDKFLALPYLRRKYNKDFTVVDRESYVDMISNHISWNENRTLYSFIKHKLNNRFPDIKSYLYDLRTDKEGNLIHANDMFANKTSRSAVLYSSIIDYIRNDKGYIEYNEAFELAEDAIKELGNEFLRLFSLRFKYVFIDEYQDCTEQQRSLLEKIFNPAYCCVFHIGDPDQAIYNVVKDKEHDWRPDEKKALSLNCSNRFKQGIADTLGGLRNNHVAVVSAAKEDGLTPLLYAYGKDLERKVLNQFVSDLHECGLEPNGVFKVIGHTKKKDLKGLRIGSYWEDFNPYINAERQSMVYCSLEKSLLDSIATGEMYVVEKKFRELCCIFLKLSSVRNPETNQYYTTTSIKNYFDTNYPEGYHDYLKKLTELKGEENEIGIIALELLEKTLSYSDENAKKLIAHGYFFDKDEELEKQGSSDNVCCIDDDYRLQFDTIHGVKGETHDATLYLETEYNRGSDVERALKWISGDKKNLYNSSRKLLYVGLSRPRKLLCLAVRRETFDKNKNCDLFRHFDIKYIEENE